MARRCTVCEHPRCDEINRALVDGAEGAKSNRGIAKYFGIGDDALRRHSAGHLTEGFKRTLIKHAEIVEETRDLDVLARLGRLTMKAEMMLTAADEWLRDPADPTRYNLNPRTHEVDVVYEEVIGDRTTRKTAKLSHLLERLEKGLGVTVIKGESRISDPRKLLLDAVDSLKPVLELLGKATGQIKPDPAVSLNLFLESRDWARIESVLLDALRPYPAAMEAAGRALATIGGQDDAG